MPLAIRPVLRVSAATALVAALSATTVLPATASPVVPPATPSPAESATGGAAQQAPEAAAEVTGEQEQTIPVTGIDPEALQAAADGPETDQETGEAGETSETGTAEPTPQAAAPRAARVSLASVVSPGTTAPAEAETQVQEAQQQALQVPEEIAAKATAETDAETAPEARQLAVTALPAEDTEQVAALTAPAETIDFIVAGVTWDVTDAGQVTEVSVRVREDGAWTDWSSLEVHGGDERPGADRTGTEPLVSSGADAVQARVSTVDGSVPEGLQVDIINPGVAETDGTLNPASPASADAAQAEAPQAEEPTAAPAASTTSSPAAEFAPAVHRQQGLITGTAAAQTVANQADVLKPAIVTRAQWGANESVVEDFGRPAKKLKAMYIHHTAGSNSYTRAGAYAQIRGIFTYHAVNLKWGDIGYQFLVDKFGTIYEGRRGAINAPVQGAQAGGFNTDTIGVSAMGNYDVAAAPAAMVTAIERVLAWQAYRYGVNPVGTTQLTQSGKGTARWSSGTTRTVPTILGHNVTNFTACPGRYLDARIPTIRKNVDNRVKQAERNHGQFVEAPATPTIPSGHYTLNGTGAVATVRWNAVSGADRYQIMYRAVPHGGGDIRQQSWIAGKTMSSTSTTLTNDPGETAQYAVRALRNGVPGPQRFLGQHTAPVAWTGSGTSTHQMTSVSSSAAVGGRALRTNGVGSAVRITGTGQSAELVLKAQVSSGTAQFRVQRDGRYAGTVKVSSGGPAVCVIPLAGNSDIRLELRSPVSVTLTSAALPRSGQTRALAGDSQRCTTPFTDVSHTASVFTAVDWMQRSGITKGYASDNTYRPGQNISRGESVAFVYRHVDPNHAPGTKALFSDVHSGNTFYAPISWAKAAGIAKGYANKNLFGVDENVTRGEFASFLYRSSRDKFTVPRTKAFRDVATTSAHHAAIAWMKKEGLSTGYADGSYRPNRPITRGEVARMLHRYDQDR